MSADSHAGLVVGIAGGTGSGKSTLARRLMWALGAERCSVVSQDNYYHDLSELSVAARARVNFDHPDSIDSERLRQDICALKAGKTVSSPDYDFSRHARKPKGIEVEPKPILIVEGILVLVWESLRAEMDLKIFVDTPDDLRLLRRVRRDIVARGRDVDGVLGQYKDTVRPMHEQFVLPSRATADMIIPGQGDNQIAVQLLAQGLAATLR